MSADALALATELIYRFEGWREYAYPDPASKLAQATVGARWGFEPADSVLSKLPPDIQNLPGDPWTIGDGETGKHIGPGTRWTRDYADASYRARLQRLRTQVERMVTVELSPHQEAALLSLAWNIGAGALGGSTLIRKLNRGDLAGAADEFLRWDKAGGKPMGGLKRRRAAERAMFMGG